MPRPRRRTASTAAALAAGPVARTTSVAAMRIVPCSSVVNTDAVGWPSTASSKRVAHVVHCTAAATGLPRGNSGMKNRLNQRRSTLRTHWRSPPQVGQKNSPVSCWCFDQRPLVPKMMNMARARYPRPVGVDTGTSARTLGPMLRPEEIERALVVTAHPDDVDFGAAATVATLDDAGVDVTYCLVTSGDAGGSDRGEPHATWRRCASRSRRAAAKHVGVSDLVWLGVPDGRRGRRPRPAHGDQPGDPPGPPAAW